MNPLLGVIGGKRGALLVVAIAVVAVAIWVAGTRAGFPPIDPARSHALMVEKGSFRFEGRAVWDVGEHTPVISIDRAEVDLHEHVLRIRSTTSVDGDVAGIVCERIETESALFARVPDELLDDFDGKRWITLDTGLPAVFNSAWLLADYRNLLTALIEAEDLRRAGTNRIRGVRATRYRATFTVSPTGHERPPAPPPEDPELPDRLREPVPWRIWIDREGLVRRTLVDETEAFRASLAPDEAREITNTTEYYDYGAPVDVSPPSPDEVAVVSEEEARPLASCLR